MVTAVRTPDLARYVTPRGNIHPAPIAEKVARDPEAVWTLQKKLSLYRDSKPHLPAVSPHGTHERIAALAYIAVTIQFSLPAVTRNELAWGVKIPCTNPEISGKLRSIRSDGGNYKDQCLPRCDVV